MMRIPAGGSRCQFAFEIIVGERIEVAAARRQMAFVSPMTV
jgi:hypothetical protein